MNDNHASIEDIEKMMNTPPADKEAINALNFKFKVGQKVHNFPFGYNAIVIRKMYVEDCDSHYNGYDLAIQGIMPPLMGECIAEVYLKADWLIE